MYRKASRPNRGGSCLGLNFNVLKARSGLANADWSVGLGYEGDRQLAAPMKQRAFRLGLSGRSLRLSQDYLSSIGLSLSAGGRSSYAEKKFVLSAKPTMRYSSLFFRVPSGLR